MYRSFFQNYALWLSILLHSLVIGFFIVRMEATSGLKETCPFFVKGYTSTRPIIKTILEKTSNTRKLALHPTHPASPFSQEKTLSSISQNIDPATQIILLKILHDAIAENQFYPDSALASQQSGTVKIGFWLSPDGKLSQIKLLKSSGFDSIDSAALSAVQSISSISEAQHYLKKESFFAIDIIFQNEKL